jgi:hypothetical protein
MKVIVNGVTPPPSFPPVTVTITVESAEEMQALYALANSSINNTHAIAKIVDRSYHDTNTVLEGLFEALHSFGVRKAVPK